MSRVLRSVGILSLAHLAGYLIPLLEIPILARALGPVAYGQVVFVQSIALICSLVVEYGFNLSASRQVSARVDDKESLSKIFANVFLAKCMLAAFVIVAVCLWGLLFGIGFDFDLKVVPWGVLYFIGFGFSPFWYYQGLEKMLFPVVMDLSLRGFSTALLYLCVSGEQDMVLAVAILASASFFNTAVTTVVCIRDLFPVRFDIFSSMKEIKRGFHVFIYRSSSNFLLNATPSVVGFSAGAEAVAAFAPAEKVVRAVTGLSSPFLTAIFPHVAKSFTVSERDGFKKSMLLILCFFCASDVAAAVIWLMGPSILNFLMGERFYYLKSIVELFAFIVPIRVTNQALCVIFFIPSNKDRVVSLFVSVFSIIALIAGAGLASSMGAKGMVWGLLGGEFGLFVSLVCAVKYIR